MLIKLPIDIWRDIFDFFSPADRPRLARKFNEIGDCEFSNFCQLWLHEWTKNVSINHLYIDRDFSCGILKVRAVWRQELIPFATQVPDNIQSFKQIQINYMDSTVLEFLRCMQPLFRNVNLHLCAHYLQLNKLEAALDQLLPLLAGGIDTLNIWYHKNMSIRHFPAQFLDIKRLDVSRMYVYDPDDMVGLIVPWLCARREDGEHRMLAMGRCYFAKNLLLAQGIRQHFLNSNDPASFLICLWQYEDSIGIIQDQDSTTQNNNTGEQLVIIQNMEYPEQPDYHRFALLVGRCPSGLDGRAWTKEMGKKILQDVEWEAQRRILISCDQQRFNL